MRNISIFLGKKGNNLPQMNKPNYTLKEFFKLLFSNFKKIILIFPLVCCLKILVVYFCSLDVTSSLFIFMEFYIIFFAVSIYLLDKLTQ